MKIKELEKQLAKAGFALVKGEGEGSHRKYRKGKTIVTVPGKKSDDAKPYLIKHINLCITREENNE